MATRSQMNRPQIRVMLDYLGVPFNKQGKTARESAALLRGIREKEPELYQQAHDLIISHKLPTGADDRQKQFHDLGKMMHEHLSSIEGEAIKKVREEGQVQVREAKTEITDFAKERIAAEARKFRKIEVTVGKAKPKVLDGIMPECFERLVQLAAMRLNIMMVGPAGCGKTFIASQVAKALDLDFASQSCSEGMSESALTGWLLPINGSQFEYVQSEFVRIYENGGVFLFDEVDAADPNVMVFMNQALANDGFYLPQRHENPYVKKHKDFVAMAAANTFGNGADQMYVGRNQLDAATLDRFKVGTVAMDYDDNVEENLVAPEVLTWGREVRQQIKANRMNRIMSTRVMLDGTKMLEAGWSIGQVAEAYFSDWSKDELMLVGRSQ